MEILIVFIGFFVSIYLLLYPHQNVSTKKDGDEGRNLREIRYV